MIQNDKFKFELGQKDNKKVVLLKGQIDEDSTFDGIAKAGNPLIINFKNLVSINSIGIRSWVNFVKELSGIQLFYEECPPLVVRQMNMVPSFLAHAQVLSVYVPYVCDACDTEKLVLLSKDQYGAGGANVPETLKCEACKEGEMELDGHPKQYFAFAK